VSRAALFLLLASSAWGADFGATLVSADEAEPIHSALVRKEAWTQEAVRWLQLDAGRRLREGPWSVTFGRPKGVALDPHEYYSESPYWWPDPAQPGGYVRRPGQANGERFAANRAALDSMSDAVLSLGAAAFLLDDPRYAKHAARIVRAWFVDPKTRMNPDMEHAGLAPPGVPTTTGPAMAEAKPLIWAMQGMAFLAQSGRWNAKDQAAVRRWFEEYLRWLAQAPANQGSDAAMWRAALQAASAIFVHDDAVRQRVFARYRNRVAPAPPPPPPGGAPPELPGPPMVNGLEARTMLCRIAQVNGADLWEGPGGRSGRGGRGLSLGGAIDSFVAGLQDPRVWSREQLAEFGGGGVSLLAFAGMGMDRPEYIAQFHKLARNGGARMALINLLTGRWEASAHQTRH
jgi:hypothetical protein